MEFPKRNWVSKSFKDAPPPNPMSRTPDMLPDSLRHQMMNFLKNDKKCAKKLNLHFVEGGSPKAEHNLSAEFKVPHFIVNKNGRVSAIQDIVLAIMLSIYNKAKPDSIRALLDQLETMCVDQFVDSFDYRLFVKSVRAGHINFESKHLLVVDCRYEYEFQGGHVRDAININDKRVADFLFIKNRQLFESTEFLIYFEQYKNKTITLKLANKIITDYLKKGNGKLSQKQSFSKDVPTEQFEDKENKNGVYNTISTIATPLSAKNATSTKHINFMPFQSRRRCSQAHPMVPLTTMIIFYCEFSSKRAPDMYNSLRSFDRRDNVHCYPDLHYPHIYLLSNGYCNFVSKYSDFCTGEGSKYTKMISSGVKSEFAKESKGKKVGVKNIDGMSGIKTRLFEL